MFHFPVINQGSPQACGLRYCWPMFGGSLTGKEVMQGNHATITAGATVAGPERTILTPAYNGTAHDGVAVINLGDVNNLTVTMWLYWDVNGTNDDLCLEYTSHADSGDGLSGAGNGFYLDVNSSNGFLCGVGGTAGGQARSFTRASQAVWHHYVFVLQRDNQPVRGVPAVYVDGRSVTLTPRDDTTLVGNFHATTNLNFMSRNGASLFGAGRLCDLRIYAGKMLSAAEAGALYDPRTRWDLYLPEERRVWAIPVAAPTGPAVGSLGLLGVGR